MASDVCVCHRCGVIEGLAAAAGEVALPCSGLSRLYFPTEPYYAERAQAARTLCGICPIRPRCLDEAHERNETEGVWGGTDMGQERRARYRKPRAARSRPAKAERIVPRRAS